VLVASTAFVELLQVTSIVFLQEMLAVVEPSILPIPAAATWLASIAKKQQVLQETCYQ